MATPNPKPPRPALTFLRVFCRPDLFDELAGDLEEQYRSRYRRMGALPAGLLLWKDVLLFLRPWVIRRGPFPELTPYSSIMWKNHVRTAARHMRRHKVVTGINILGLGIGIATALLALLFIQDERAFDAFHEQADRLYRVRTDLQNAEGRQWRFPGVAWPVSPIIRDEYPTVEHIVRMLDHDDEVRLGNERFHERVFVAEDGFFELFSFEMIQGSASTALAEPYTAVITQAAAQRLFGTSDVVGRTIMLQDSVAHILTAVVADPPRRSSIDFDILVSYSTWDAGNTEAPEDHWLDLNMYAFLLVRDDADITALRTRLSGLYEDHAGKMLADIGYEATARLEPLRSVYMRSEAGNPFGPSSDVRYLYLLGCIGALMLLVAVINFINLATARSAERAREVGVRKAVGATRSPIIQQFMSEALLMVFVALGLGWGMAALGLPYFNHLTQKALPAGALVTPEFMALGLLVGLAVGVLSGLYPAIVLSRHHPARVLKGGGQGQPGGRTLRRTLVVGQYGLACVLMVSTLVGAKQIDFMRSTDTGFQRENVLVIDAWRVPSWTLFDALPVLRKRLGGHPGVEWMTGTSAVPGRDGWRSILVFPEGRESDDGLTLEFIASDAGFVPTFGLQMLAGRNFDLDRPADADESILINASAVSAMGYESPEDAVGRFVRAPNRNAQGTIVGVVDDYHHHGLQEHIQPIIYGVKPHPRFVAIRTRGEVPALVSEAERVWSDTFPGYDFDYFFLDEDYDRQYMTETRLTQVFMTFAVLSIFVSCLGLFGLSAYTISRRTKEIGVRKVLGATRSQIVGTVSREFLLLVVVAFALAVPVSWILVNSWLASFANRTDVGAGVYALTAVLAVSVALLTVGYHALRAANLDPARSLKYE
ncbi:MAG: FtsX-like permease family protein [Rhodothermales bacterium]